MVDKKIEIYTDGGSRGNPGPSALGAVLYDVTSGKKRVAELSEYLGETTNNQAEYTAIIRALERALELGATEVDCYLDSQLAVKQLTLEYKVKDPEIAKRFTEAWKLLQKFKKYSFTHVRREFNKEADALVNEALDKAEFGI